MNDLQLHRLRTETFVSRVEYHRALVSTNDRARRIAEEGSGSLPVLVIADEQTAGRGRGTNRWWTGTGSLAFSLLFDPAARGIQRPWLPLMSLAAALAIVETCEPRAPNVRLGVHWPNDVFASDRKLAGVLVEALADGRHILGIGWNVNNSSSQAPLELAEIVTSLCDLSPGPHDRTLILVEALSRLDVLLDHLAQHPKSISRRADVACLQHGKTLTIEAGKRQTTGVCAGIAPDGALLLDTPSGRQSHYCGVLIHAHEPIAPVRTAPIRPDAPIRPCPSNP
ncbi:MAG TPA: biotin--[acetyl-CoA-carboxylase] ligase [Pirellulales bacterium]|nr:biotin--[acetyl-CoA-carboxylase] ligase [Pirellulales bacterium]